MTGFEDAAYFPVDMAVAGLMALRDKLGPDGWEEKRDLVILGTRTIYMICLVVMAQIWVSLEIRMRTTRALRGYIDWPLPSILMVVGLVFLSSVVLDGGAILAALGKPDILLARESLLAGPRWVDLSAIDPHGAGAEVLKHDVTMALRLEGMAQIGRGAILLGLALAIRRALLAANSLMMPAHRDWRMMGVMLGVFGGLLLASPADWKAVLGDVDPLARSYFEDRVAG